MMAFNDELNSFRERVRGRAKARIEEAIKEYEEVHTSFRYLSSRFRGEKVITSAITIDMPYNSVVMG